MKFIHAADIHLDSPLHGLSAYPDAPVGQLRGASRAAFTQLVDKAIEEAVDFMVIAGDLYDGDWKDHNTGIFFSREMGRLKRAGIRVFLLYGNHDAESEMTRRLSLPDNVTAFSSRKAEVFRIDELKVALHGQSFRDKAVVDNLALAYPAPVAGYYNIGVLHTALEGYAAHVSYAPCTREELHARGYDYWALGHVHDFQHWDEQSHIVFPGNLQGRNIRETGRRGAVLVTVEDGRSRIERLLFDVLRWEAVAVDAGGSATLADLARQIGQQLDGLLATDAQVPRAVRITVHGRSAAHGALFGKARELRAEVLGQIAAIGNERLWLEKVRVVTEPLEQPGALAHRSDAIADLQDILAEAASDPEFLAQLGADLQPFFAKVPADVREDTPLLALARDGSLAALVARVAPDLLASLAEGQ